MIEARVKHDVAYDELHRADPHSSDAIQKNVWFSKRTYAKVHSRKSVPHLNVHEIAAKLREAGVGQQTMILAWHNYYTDYDLLQKLLEGNGYGDILPPRSNCIPFIPQYRKNLRDAKLPGGKRFPLALEILFPLLFPGHDLVGKNHAALANAQQLRLVAQVFEDACLRPTDRDIAIPKYTRQQVITDLMPGADKQNETRDKIVGRPTVNRASSKNGGMQLKITDQLDVITMPTNSDSEAQSESRRQPRQESKPANTKKRGRGRRKQQVVGADQPRITESFPKTPKDQ